MKPKTVEALAWLLIYSGLLLLSLGLFLRRSDDLVGWLLIAAGVADAATGATLIWWRSRMTDDTLE
ncbi:MAG: hypothetical protein IPH51_02595 [Rubrivivax sp.]|nr:hypothetical protein [Rubrivivax sp.]MBK8526774.1 hypothetical protein [Rubrivivax sp.]